MSQALATRGYESGIPPGGGGGGSGPSGTLVPFELRDTSGTLQAGIDLSGAGVVQVSKDGAAFANRLGSAPTSIGGGAYYYQLDASEIGTQWTLVKIVLAGYQSTIERESFGDVAKGTDLSSDFTNLTNTMLAVESAIAGSISSAVTSVNAHTDTEASSINSNTDSQVSSAVSSINAHTDTDTTTITTAIASVLTAIANAITTVDSNTTSQVSGAVSSLSSSLPSAIVAALIAYSPRTGRTVKGILRRLDALASGTATGMNSALAKFFAPDGVTVEISATQNTTSGIRSAVDVSGSES